jgi:hypothetical protein
MEYFDDYLEEFIYLFCNLDGRILIDSFCGHLNIINKNNRDILFCENGDFTFNNLPCYTEFHVGCKFNVIQIVKHAMKIGLTRLDTVWGLGWSCGSGNLKIVKKIMKICELEWNMALNHACGGGNIEVIKFIIDKGKGKFDVNCGFSFACYEKNIDIMKLLIKEGAIKCDFCHKAIEQHI